MLVVTLGIWGIEPIAYLQYPGAATLRVLRMPGILVERLGAFVALSWTMLGIAFVSVRFWTIPLGCSEVFGLGPRSARYFLWIG